MLQLERAKRINTIRGAFNRPQAALYMPDLNRLAVSNSGGGTVKIFDDGEKYYALLMDRVGALMKQGKSLDDIKKEVKMPEYASWGSQDRMPTNVEAAYKALGGRT